MKKQQIQTATSNEQKKYETFVEKNKLIIAFIFVFVLNAIWMSKEKIVDREKNIVRNERMN